MKYIIVLADGMADEPIEALNNKTPLEVAKTPMFDRLANVGEVGLVDTIPQGMNPGSDTANLSVMGYDPRKYYTGRSPLEAVSIGVEMQESDICFRVNFVTLTEEETYWNKTIEDHSADEITTQEAAILLEAVKEAFEDAELTFYQGVSYRHALIWDHGSMDVNLEPPHNILGKQIAPYQPTGDNSEQIRQMMERSFEILNHHPVNEARRQKGLRPANSIWPWGEGVRPELPDFEKMFNKKGAMISAVDLLKGIAIAANMKSIDVEGATGNIHTNYQGKVDAAIRAFEDGYDFVYLHVEAPDECGHRGELDNKIKAIELIDEKVVAPIYHYFKEKEEAFKIGILPDHPTPLHIRTHTNDPVPYLIYTSEQEKHNHFFFSEAGAKASGKIIKQGYQFMPYFLGK